MITWVQKRFKDRAPTYTATDEIDLWLHNLPGEVKHFSMVPMGSLLLAVVGYEEPPEDYTASCTKIAELVENDRLEPSGQKLEA